nr:unnamed protein product [Callosobruchus chinensis]
MSLPVSIDFMWSLGALPDGFPAAAYAAYATGRGYSGYPSFGLPYPTGNSLAALHHHHGGAAAAAAALLPLHPHHPALEHHLAGVYGAAAAAAAATAGLHAMPLFLNHSFPKRLSVSSNPNKVLLVSEGPGARILLAGRIEADPDLSFTVIVNVAVLYLLVIISLQKS